MTDNGIEITQKSAFGSETTQIAVQNNYTGLSASDAVNMAFSMFREYYPQLRQEALSELKKLVEEKLKELPAENIIQPTPRIAVPTLQNASITEEQDIRKLYANLLVSSMNKVVKDGVHPSFVEIIKQLCPDEAKVLKYFTIHKIVPTITLRYENEEGAGIDILKNFSDIGEKTKCEKPFQINIYFDNLIRLGLLESAANLLSLTNKALYEPLKNHNHIVPIVAQAATQKNEYNKAKFTESYMEITDYGKAFCKVCLLPKEVITILPL